MSKATLENRLTQLETAPRRQRTVQMMTDTELCKIIGIADPTDEQLMAVIEGEL